MPRMFPPIPEQQTGNATMFDQLIILKPGDSGNAIRIIQERLISLRFDPGPADGQYGPQTTQAIAQFQFVNNLASTGAVDNATLRALGYEVEDSAPAPQSSQLFSVERVRKMFPDASLQNLEAYLPLVLTALQEFHLNDPPMTLVALATIRAETGVFAPISEYPSQYNTASGGALFALYDFRKDLGNGAVGDGARYKGRGFIQLTGKSNYQQYSKKLGLGDALVQRPELANDPLIAARLLACFLKDKKSIIRNALAAGNFAAARKAVNGGSHGLDSFTTAYQVGAKQVGLA